MERGHRVWSGHDNRHSAYPVAHYLRVRGWADDIRRLTGGVVVIAKILKYILDFFKSKPIIQVGDIGISPDGRIFRVISIHENDNGWLIGCQYETNDQR